MSNFIKFAVLLVGALLIALIVRVVLASASGPSRATDSADKVLVSAAGLPQGLLLRAEDLTWKEMPKSQVPSNAIVSGATNAPELKGALLRHPVDAGTVLVVDDVFLPSAPGFLAATLKPEMRAVSVAVDDVSGNAGLIQPGDYVDLILTQQMDHRTDSPELAVSSETVVEHVRVLAVGSEIKRPKNDGDTPDLSAMRSARTVTLEVTPRMAEVVAVAARLGSLSLALRSFATASRDPSAPATGASASERAPIWAGDISRAVRDLPRPRVAAPSAPGPAPFAPAAVVIYRGSEKSDTSSVAQAGGSATVPPLPAVPAAR